MIICSNIGFPWIFNIGFGQSIVSGNNLFPNPPAKIKKVFSLLFTSSTSEINLISTICFL